ncbi:hypothetical protein BB558_006452, partial [Smittium angustum]
YCNKNNPSPVCGKLKENSRVLDLNSRVYKLHNSHYNIFQTPGGKQKRRNE